MKLIKSTKIILIIGAILLSLAIFTQIRAYDMFKSEVLLQAKLVDDLSNLELKLRKDSSYELKAETYLGSTEPTYGSYKVEGDKIVLTDFFFGNQQIDTLHIINDKIIMGFETDGNPDTSFASFFKIEINKF